MQHLFIPPCHVWVKYVDCIIPQNKCCVSKSNRTCCIKCQVFRNILRTVTIATATTPTFLLTPWKLAQSHSKRTCSVHVPLKMISRPYCAFSRVSLGFWFDSCKTSLNVTFCNHFHEVNSKFHINHHHGCEALSFVLSDYFRPDKTAF